MVTLSRERLIKLTTTISCSKVSFTAVKVSFVTTPINVIHFFILVIFPVLVDAGKPFW